MTRNSDRGMAVAGDGGGGGQQSVARGGRRWQGTERVVSGEASGAQGGNEECGAKGDQQWWEQQGRGWEGATVIPYLKKNRYCRGLW